MLNSKDFILYIMDGYTLTKEALLYLLDQMTVGTDSSFDSITQFSQIYFYILGVLIIICMGLITMMQWLKMKNYIVSINYLLIMIPFDKLNEEATLHMLKRMEIF